MSTAFPGRSPRRPGAALAVAGVLALLVSACAPASGTVLEPGGSTPTTPSTSAPTSPTASPTSAAPSPTEATPSASDTPSPTPSASTAAALLKPGDSGDRVRELQHRLLQIGWYSGQITPNYGDTTTGAVKGFQDKRDLEATGVVDQKTWDSLAAMTRKPTHDEMYNVLKAGPAILEKGDEGTQVKKLQARLSQIGWFAGKITGYYGDDTATGVKGFQTKRAIPTTGEVDQRTWDRLLAMTREPTAEELSNKPPKGSSAGLDSRCMTGRVLCISKGTSTLKWVIDGKVQSTFAVRFGSELTPTREGSFSVGWKSRDHVSSIYHTPMPFAMFFSGGQAVHYSADFAARGYNGASHGCVNVRDRAGIAALFDQVRVGDKVIVYR